MNSANNPVRRPHPAAALSSLCVDMADLCEAQDATLMQVMTIAKLMNAALDSEAEDASDDAAHALKAIVKLAGTAIEELDCALKDSRG